jgi:hypothetical protein
MRRRFVLMAAALIACALVATGGVLLFGKRDTPFRFLDGCVPVQGMFGPSVKAGIPGVIDYTFKADYETFTKAAKAELTTLGYREAVRRDEVKFIYGGTSSALHVVAIRRGTRFEYDGVMVFRPGREKEWVTVQMSGQRPKGTFDTLRSWLGL